MKIKKILALSLAVITATSLFACKNGDDTITLAPQEQEVEQVVDGNLVYQTVAGRMTPRLAYSEDSDYDSWRKQLRERFIDVLGLDNIAQNACPLDVKLEETVQKEGYTRYRFVFNSEYGSTVPCYLLVPNTGAESYPLVITLQGHSTGFHRSIGEAREGVEETISYSSQFAVQAVNEGYVALAIEQRGMGERMSELDAKECKENGKSTVCDFSAYNALLLGRTIIGERVWDVSKAIDALSDDVLKDITAKIDMSDITITGNSGGGTASFYAGCYDERITLTAPSCAFCSYEDSLLYENAGHCSCNFLPNAYEWFDMQDLTCLIAPRKLLIYAGATDDIFLIDGVEKGYETVEKIYAKAGVGNYCKLVTENSGHLWREDVIWSAIKQLKTK